MGRWGGLTLAIALAGGLLGCSSSVEGSLARGAEAPKAVDYVQILVQFQGVADPSDPRFLANLSREVGISLAYIRPMSGGIHVLRAGVPSGAVTEALLRLRARPEIVDVMVDQPVRRQ